MNRYAFIGSQTDAAGQEWCYILDTETGTTLKSPVKAFGAAPVKVAPGTVFSADTTAPGAVRKAEAPEEAKKPADSAGEVETAEQREHRLKHPKVPAAFSPRMYHDPAKGGVADVTPAR